MYLPTPDPARRPGITPHCDKSAKEFPVIAGRARGQCRTDWNFPTEIFCVISGNHITFVGTLLVTAVFIPTDLY